MSVSGVELDQDPNTRRHMQSEEQVKRDCDPRPAHSAAFISRAAGVFFAPERPILMMFTAFWRTGKTQALVLVLRHTSTQRSCILYWKSRDPAKMTYTRFDLFKRGPSSMQP